MESTVRTKINQEQSVFANRGVRRIVLPVRQPPVWLQRLFVALCKVRENSPQLKGGFRRHSLSGVRNERNNAALHKVEIAVPSHKAAEME